MSLIGAFGKVAGVLVAVAVGLVLLPVVVIAIVIAFASRQRPQQVSAEAPEPFIHARIVHQTSAPGVGTAV